MKFDATVKIPDAIRYATAFKSTTALAANTAETVFSAASNVNGAVVWRAGAYMSVNGSVNNAGGFVAHTAAPTGLSTGDVLAIYDAWLTQSTYYGASLKCETPIFIPAGRGLFFIDTNGQTLGFRHVLYTLY